MTKTDILYFLREKELFLQQDFHIDSIGLCGFYTRDEVIVSSDIDFLMTTYEKSFRNRYKLKE